MSGLTRWDSDATAGENAEKTIPRGVRGEGAFIVRQILVPMWWRRQSTFLMAGEALAPFGMLASGWPQPTKCLSRTLDWPIDIRALSLTACIRNIKLSAFLQHHSIAT